MQTPQFDFDFNNQLPLHKAIEFERSMSGSLPYCQIAHESGASERSLTMLRTVSNAFIEQSVEKKDGSELRVHIIGKANFDALVAWIQSRQVARMYRERRVGAGPTIHGGATAVKLSNIMKAHMTSFIDPLKISPEIVVCWIQGLEVRAPYLYELPLLADACNMSVVGFIEAIWN